MSEEHFQTREFVPSRLVDTLSLASYVALATYALGQPLLSTSFTKLGAWVGAIVPLENKILKLGVNDVNDT